MALVLVLLLGLVLALLLALALAPALALVLVLVLVLAPVMTDLSWRDDYSTVRFASLRVSVAPPCPWLSLPPSVVAVAIALTMMPLVWVPAMCRLSSCGGFSSRSLVCSLSFVPPRCPWRLLPVTVPALAMVMVLALWALASVLWVGTT